MLHNNALASLGHVSPAEHRRYHTMSIASQLSAHRKLHNWDRYNRDCCNAQGPFSSRRRRLLHSVVHSISFSPLPIALATSPFSAVIQYSEYYCLFGVPAQTNQGFFPIQTREGTALSPKSACLLVRIPCEHPLRAYLTGSSIRRCLVLGVES